MKRKGTRALLMVGLAAMLSVGLTACKSESTEARIAEAYKTGGNAADSEWGADKVEVDRDKDRGLGAKVNNDMSSFNVAQKSVEENSAGSEEEGVNNIITFVLDGRTGLFHRPDCEEVPKISQTQRQNFYGSKDDAIAQTYQPCTICKP